MVGSNHNQILFSQLFHKLGKPLIEFVQSQGIAINISAMTINHIEINQIDKAQTVEVLVGIVHCMFQTIGIGGVVNMLGSTLTGKDVVDLTNRNGVQTICLNDIQQGILGRFQRIVVTVGGTLKTVYCIAYERTGDDTTHTMLTLQQLSCDVAILVQLVNGHHFFMRCNLENRVSRSIHDQITGLHMFFTELGNNFGSGHRTVCQNTTASCLLERLQNFFGESVGISGQRIGGNNASNFPVTNGRILAHGGFRQFTVCTHRSIYGSQEIQAIDITQAARYHIGNIQLGRGCAGSQGIDTDIAKAFRVRHCTSTAGIQHKQKNSFHADTSITCSP